LQGRSSYSHNELGEREKGNRKKCHEEKDGGGLITKKFAGEKIASLKNLAKHKEDLR